MIYAVLDPWKNVEVQLEITGIWVQSRMTEYFEFLVLDRIIGRFIEEKEEFCFLANACFKSQVREQEKLQARPQNQKSYICTQSLLGHSNPRRSAAGKSVCFLPHFLHCQESLWLTSLAFSRMGLQMFSGHSVGIAREE